MRAISDINDPRLVKALAHPLRVSVLGILEDREASPSELAQELSAPLGNVSYHVRILSNLGLIKLVRKKPRRGAIEHYYRARERTRVSDAAWGEVPTIVKGALVESALRQALEFAGSGASVGGFERPEAHLTRQSLTLDEQGLTELAAALAELHERAQEIQTRSTERLGGGASPEIATGLVMMLFGASPDPAHAPDSVEWRISPRARRQTSGRSRSTSQTAR